jgi:hypothetical protein
MPDFTIKPYESKKMIAFHSTTGIIWLIIGLAKINSNFLYIFLIGLGILYIFLSCGEVHKRTEMLSKELAEKL